MILAYLECDQERTTWGSSIMGYWAVPPADLFGVTPAVFRAASFPPGFSYQPYLLARGSLLTGAKPRSYPFTQPRQLCGALLPLSLLRRSKGRGRYGPYHLRR